MEKLKNLSATQLLKLIDKGEVSSREVTQHFIDKIKEVNPTLNAVVIELFESALKKADYADEQFKQGKRLGRLHGLPFTVKECIDLKGTPSTLGIVRRKNKICQNTDSYLEALQNEGGIILGKTNVAQMLMFFESDNPVYGTTNNPLSAKHTCGGSSGGEGAIIGAGGSPAGIGTDIGGSLRIPAAFCGICSIKPTGDRIVDHTRVIDTPPKIAIGSVEGPMAAHAEDLQLFLEIMNEVAAKERQVQPLKNFKEVELKKLKVGYFLTDGIFEPMPAVKRGILEAVEQLKKAGVEVVEFVPPDLREAVEIFVKIMAADNAPLVLENLGNEKAFPQAKGFVLLARLSPFARNTVKFFLKIFGQKKAAEVLPHFGGKGEQFRKETLAKQKAYIEKYINALDNSAIGKLDAVLSPVCAVPAYLHNTSGDIGTAGAYTVQYNLTGFPAGIATVSKVKPEEAVGRKKTMDMQIRAASKIEAASAGLPLAVQIAARPWNEHIVIALINELHKKI